MANVHRLRSTLGFVEANPGLWDQGSWLDCFAAIAVENAGYVVLPSLWVRVGYRSVKVWDVAAEVLDLTGAQARRLFAPGTSMAELRKLIAEFAAARPPRLSVPRHARLRPVG
ncbi:hypothetical protein GCM10009839_14230 [Catenulispora yoronensis]|uniref:Uncharacterized protein n=1 Tax=Catenulispora yoronensis TaxID=450799 RepID=A0ABP5F780_9ACTN